MAGPDLAAVTAPAPGVDALPAAPLLDVEDVSFHARGHRILDGVSLAVHRGEIHAVLGPNGAGKSTLLRMMGGLIEPRTGTVRVAGHPAGSVPARRTTGWVPSGDRSFYLRLSGFENLLFFGRLQGLPRRAARLRATEALERVGLADAAAKRAGLYSHGMQRRLAVARALLSDSSVLLIDEATHDLDPAGAQSVLDLVRELAGGGAAVVWTTQRLEEIRGFATSVNLLVDGRLRFRGSVEELVRHASASAFVVRVAATRGTAAPAELVDRAAAALAGKATLTVMSQGSDDLALDLAEGTTLGEALTCMRAAGVDAVRCRDRRSDIDEAFARLTAKDRS